MPVTIHYLAQIKKAVGRAEESFESPPARTLVELIRFLADRHPDAAPLLLDRERQPNRSLLFFVNDAPIAAAEDLPNSAVVTILAPMAGG